MGLLDIFKKNDGRSAQPQTQPQLQLTADEVLEQGKAFESLGDMEAAFKTYLQATEMGNTEAMHKVGQAYLYKHKGAPFDLKKSAYWYEKAAKGGCPSSMMMLSQCYLAGAGVPESDEIARQWMESAIEESRRIGENKTIEIATRRLNDMAGTQKTFRLSMRLLLKWRGFLPKSKSILWSRL